MVIGVAGELLNVDRRESRINSWSSAGKEEACTVRAVIRPACRSEHVHSGWSELQVFAARPNVSHADRSSGYDSMLYVQTPLKARRQRRIGLIIQACCSARR